MTAPCIVASLVLVACAWAIGYLLGRRRANRSIASMTSAVAEAAATETARQLGLVANAQREIDSLKLEVNELNWLVPLGVFAVEVARRDGAGLPPELRARVDAALQRAPDDVKASLAALPRYSLASQKDTTRADSA